MRAFNAIFQKTFASTVSRHAVLAFILAAMFYAPSSAKAAIVRTIATQHYRIETDLDPELADDCARRMDAMYDEYARRFAGVADLHDAPIFQVYLYQKRGEYLHRVGIEFQNTGGLFVPGQQFLAAFLDGRGRDSLRQTLQHEAFHQFVHQAFPNNLPVWLNEGLAQLFEEGMWTGQQFWIGQVPPRRVRQLHAELKSGQLLDFKTLAALSPQQWSRTVASNRSGATAQYDQAWAMVYFLTHVKNAAGHEVYRDRLFKLLQLLHDGTDGVEAFNSVFPDAGQIQSQFLDYAAALEPTAEAILMERQSILADLVVDLHDHEAMPDGMMDLRDALARGGYRTRYVQGEVHWESAANVKTYFADLAGKPFSHDEFFLHSRRGAPIPDIVCKCFDHFQLRTRFHAQGGKIEHEILIEPCIATQTATSSAR